MAFKLTKAEHLQRDEIVADLEIAAGELADAIAAYNGAVAAAHDELISAVEAYNAKLEEAREFAEDIASSREAELSERSERWQESDKGQAAQQFVDAWQGVELEPVELELPEDLEVPDLAHRDELEGLPASSDEA